MDAALWPALFIPERAGDPVTLFEQALGAGRWRTAACCLLLVEGTRTSADQASQHLVLALRLLRAALALPSALPGAGAASTCECECVHAPPRPA